MMYSRSLIGPASTSPVWTSPVAASGTTPARAKRGRLAQVTLGIVSAALCIGPVSFASAQAYHHRLRAHARDYMAEAYPGGFGGPVVGNWRYGLSAHRPNDRAYPMTEWSGPATATGGPSGGIN